MKFLLRSTFVWTLSILLGVQPAVFAANKTVNGDIKAFLEQSGITKKSMTFREFYAKNFDVLPAEAREQILPLINAFPNYQIPKIDVNKISGPNGDEVYQLQAVQGGKAVSMALYATDKVFAKLNGTNISSQDFQDARIVMAKAGVPKKEIEKYIAAKGPAAASEFTAHRARKLPLAQRQQYVKELQELLQSIEAVQNSGVGDKTSSLPESKYEFFVKIFTGEFAVAATAGQSCVAAGYEATLVFNKGRQVNGKPSPGLTCGSDGNGNVNELYRKDCPGKRDFRCNRDLFGGDAPCVAAGPETTANCSKQVQDKLVDIPDKADSLKKFNELRQNAIKTARELQAICKTQYKESGIAVDQKYTCEKLNERLAVIESWKCDDESYKLHPNLKPICATVPTVPVVPPVPPQVPPPAVVPPVAPAQPGVVMCSELPTRPDMSQNKDALEAICRGGIVRTTECYAPEKEGNLKAQPAWICKCDKGGTAPHKCDGATAPVVPGTHGKPPEPGFHIPGWMMVAGIGIFGLLIFHWLQKRAAKEAYSQISPDTINPPITVPVITVPPLPPPIPVAPKGAQ